MIAGDADKLARLFSDGLEALGVSLGQETQTKLLEFLRLLGVWNRTYNLTRISAPADAVRLHLLDSLTALSCLRGPCVLDLGTGAGLPGIPLALASPKHEFVLLDSVAKKVRFCRHAITALGLENVRAVHGRAEQLGPKRSFDTIITRAVGPITRVVSWSQHLLAPDGRWVFMKSEHPTAELDELGPMGENAKSIRVCLPGEALVIPEGGRRQNSGAGPIIRRLIIIDEQGTVSRS